MLQVISKKNLLSFIFALVWVIHDSNASDVPLCTLSVPNGYIYLFSSTMPENSCSLKVVIQDTVLHTNNFVMYSYCFSNYTHLKSHRLNDTTYLIFDNSDLFWGITPSGILKCASFKDLGPYGGHGLFRLYSLKDGKFALFMQTSICYGGGVCGVGRVGIEIYKGTMEKDSLLLDKIITFDNIKFNEVFQSGDTSFYICGLSYPNSISNPDGFFYSILGPDLSIRKQGVLPCSSEELCLENQCTKESIDNTPVKMQVHKIKDFSMKVTYSKQHIAVSTTEPVSSLRIFDARGCCIKKFNSTSKTERNNELYFNGGSGIYFIQAVVNNKAVIQRLLID